MHLTMGMQQGDLEQKFHKIQQQSRILTIKIILSLIRSHMIKLWVLIEVTVCLLSLKKNGVHSEVLKKEWIMTKSLERASTMNSMELSSMNFDLKLAMRNLNIMDLSLGHRQIGTCIKSLFKNFIPITIVSSHKNMTMHWSRNTQSFRRGIVIRMCRSLCQQFACMGIMGTMLAH